MNRGGEYGRKTPNLAHSDLIEVVNNPDNQHCVDCGQKAPRWASVNLGILMCIECSGHHRNMGVHLSTVKSLTLDKWQPKWITMVQNVGNRIANNFYEYSVPSSYHRPNSSDSVQTIKAWIEQKYIQKQFAPPGKVPPCDLVLQGKNPDVYGADQTNSDVDEAQRQKSKKKKEESRHKSKTKKKIHKKESNEQDLTSDSNQVKDFIWWDDENSSDIKFDEAPPPCKKFDDPAPCIKFDDPPPCIKFDDPPSCIKFDEAPPCIIFDEAPPCINFDEPSSCINFDNDPQGFNPEGFKCGMDPLSSGVHLYKQNTPGGHIYNQNTPGGHIYNQNTPGGHIFNQNTPGGYNHNAMGGHQYSLNTPGGHHYSQNTPGGHQVNQKSPGGNQVNQNSVNLLDEDWTFQSVPGWGNLQKNDNTMESLKIAAADASLARRSSKKSFENPTNSPKKPSRLLAGGDINAVMRNLIDSPLGETLGAKRTGGGGRKTPAEKAASPAANHFQWSDSLDRLDPFALMKGILYICIV
eukprot:GHVL01041757.1.p1 GENE.GHVL01041757.1~~GHVL01041757.1.p1  ORF type:complete len:535 (+),score=151.67 GHVL01041757.1:43-1605(+)